MIEFNVSDAIEAAARRKYPGATSQHNLPGPQKTGKNFWVTVVVPIDPNEVIGIEEVDGMWRMEKKQEPLPLDS